MRLIAGAGDGYIPSLQMPSENDLRRGLAVCCRDGRNGIVTEEGLCVAAPAQREPGLQHCAVLRDMLLHF